MIKYNFKRQFKQNVLNDLEELENYKKAYNKKIDLCCKNKDYLKSALKDEDEEILDTLTKKIDEIIKECKEQIEKIDRNMEVLNNILENYEKSNKKEITKQISRYNTKYKEIKKKVIINSWLFDERMMLSNMETKEKTIDENKIETVENNKNNEEINDLTLSSNFIENNDTLLVSEILGKVILPYTGEEVAEILYDKNNNYNTAEEVILDRFVRKLSDYRYQFISRYNETIKLATEREKYKKTDAVTLALEMMTKRYLHPAIITACRTLDELDVYLDCLEKNEVDDFKIFKIKYELYPTVIKEGKLNILKKVKQSHNKRAKHAK